jgi:hypothetical protein
LYEKEQRVSTRAVVQVWIPARWPIMRTVYLLSADAAARTPGTERRKSTSPSRTRIDMGHLATGILPHAPVSRSTIGG